MSHALPSEPEQTLVSADVGLVGPNSILRSDLPEVRAQLQNVLLVDFAESLGSAVLLRILDLLSDAGTMTLGTATLWGVSCNTLAAECQLSLPTENEAELSRSTTIRLKKQQDGPAPISPARIEINMRIVYKDGTDESYNVDVSSGSPLNTTHWPKNRQYDESYPLNSKDSHSVLNRFLPSQTHGVLSSGIAAFPINFASDLREAKGIYLGPQLLERHYRLGDAAHTFLSPNVPSNCFPDELDLRQTNLEQIQSCARAAGLSHESFLINAVGSVMSVMDFVQENVYVFPKEGSSQPQYRKLATKQFEPVAKYLLGESTKLIEALQVYGEMLAPREFDGLDPLIGLIFLDAKIDRFRPETLLNTAMFDHDDSKKIAAANRAYQAFYELGRGLVAQGLLRSNEVSVPPFHDIDVLPERQRFAGLLVDRSSEA